MNKLAVMVTTPPYSNLTATAIDFVESALKANIEVLGVFFYQDGVLHGNKFAYIPTDEYQSIAQWRQLNKEFNLPLHLCITAAEKRGLSDDNEQSNIDDAFSVSGLGELVELSSQATRVVQF